MDSASSTDPDDEEAIARIRGGDVEAYALLVERHKRHVARVVARNVPRGSVPEVAHECFVAAYTSLPSYRATHSFEQWLTRLALRSCSDYWRKHYRDRERAGAGLDESPLLSPETDQASDRELLDWALAQLELENRQVITLVYLEDLSVKEAAELLGWSQAKVKVRAFRARKLLRDILGRVLPELRTES